MLFIHTAETLEMRKKKNVWLLYSYHCHTASADQPLTLCALNGQELSAWKVFTSSITLAPGFLGHLNP